MSTLSEQIFAADDIQSELVNVEVWNVSLEVRSMTALDRARMISTAQDNDGKFSMETVLPDLVIHCSFDPETGERVFKDSDKKALMSKSAIAIEQIATVAMRLSGMSDGAVDEAGKDSSLTPTDDSSSS